jgi:hypothetical protein
MDNNLLKLKGANMDIDLASNDGDIHWQQDKCPWNLAENSNEHKCAIKNVSICKYFGGIEKPDTVICNYREL